MERKHITKKQGAQLGNKNRVGKKHSEKTKQLYRDTRGGEKHPGWKGGRFMSDDGYWMIRAIDHPRANAAGYIREHRLVVEKMIGRYLTKDEYIHHKNGIKTDNRLENLTIVAPTNHYGEVKCPHCLTSFVIR